MPVFIACLQSHAVPVSRLQAHFLKLRAALTFYYQGEQNLDAKHKSRPGDEVVLTRA